MAGRAFRQAVEARDLDGMTAVLAADVVLHSPVSFKPFTGIDEVASLLAILLRTFTDFRYTDELEADGLHALIFQATVGDRQVQGLDLLRVNEEGLVDDFTVMVRPLSAAVALAEAVGPQLAAQAGTD